MQKLKENLINFRKQRGLTQEEFAPLIDLKTSAYRAYETGRNEPNITTLKKIADFYDISVDQLVCRPRPYDLPSYTTQEQKNVIKTILQLNEINTMKVQAYCLGLLANQN